MAVHEQPVEVEVRIENLGRILRDTKAFDAKLATYIRREIRNAGKLAASDVQNEIRSAPVKGRSTGLREGIARGVRVQISTGKRTNGVRIAATSSRLPASKAPMVKAYNRPTFRHPVFGNSNEWVTQRGRPYFGAVIARRQPEVQRGILRALDMAAQAISHNY